MKISVSTILRLVGLLAFAAFFSAAVSAQSSQSSAQSEKGRIRLDSLDRLSQKAGPTVNVNVDGALIQIGVALLSDDDPEEKAVRELAANLRGVYVRRLEFKSAGQYTEADLAELRSQLAGSGWKKLVDVSGGAADVEFEDAEVYVATDGGKIEGFVVIAAEPRALTVANIVGAVDLEKLRRLGGQLGIPDIRIKGPTVTIDTGRGAKKKP